MAPKPSIPPKHWLLWKSQAQVLLLSSGPGLKLLHGVWTTLPQSQMTPGPELTRACAKHFVLRCKRKALGVKRENTEANVQTFYAPVTFMEWSLTKSQKMLEGKQAPLTTGHPRQRTALRTQATHRQVKKKQKRLQVRTLWGGRKGAAPGRQEQTGRVVLSVEWNRSPPTGHRMCTEFLF